MTTAKSKSSQFRAGGKKKDILSGPLALSIDPSGRFVSATTYFAEVDKMRYR